jgi:hypothetical protein
LPYLNVWQCAGVALLALGAGSGFAATITVAPGGSIQSAIDRAATGDTVVVQAGDYSGGVRVTRAITLRGQPGAKLHATTPGTGVGVEIYQSGTTVSGLYLDSFNMGIAPAGLSPLNNVTVRYNHSYYSQYHVWINGANWQVIGNEFERVRWWNGWGDADYTRMFGTGHVFRGNYLHGTDFTGTDLAPLSGSDYAHTDGIQYYGTNGEVLQDCLIEGNFFTDFHQGIFFCDETTGSLARLTIRNNVFWGQTYTPPPGSSNFIGIPSWGICIGKDVGGTDMVVQNNLLYNCATFFGIRAGSTGRWVKNIVRGRNSSGTIYDLDTYSPWLVTIDNFISGMAAVGQSGFTGTDIVANPSFANSADPLGADTLTMTQDDGWLPMNPAAAGYGPQLSAVLNPLKALADERDFFYVDDLNRDATLTLAESGLTADQFALADSDANGLIGIVELLLATVGNPGIASIVHVNFGYVGWELGTATQPFNTTFEAANYVAKGGTIKFAAPRVGESVAIRGQMVLRLDAP